MDESRIFIKIAGKQYPIDNRLSTLMSVMSVWNPIYIGMKESQQKTPDTTIIMAAAIGGARKMGARFRYKDIKDAISAGIVPVYFCYWATRRMMDVPWYRKPSIRYMMKNITTKESADMMSWIATEIFKIEPATGATQPPKPKRARKRK